MTARRLREWPRLVVAVALFAIVLVLVGVVVASASSGGSSNGSAQTSRALRGAESTQSARLRGDDQARARLQLALTRASAAVTAARTQLRASRAAARCWRAKASHPKRERQLHCGAIQ